MKSFTKGLISIKNSDQNYFYDVMLGILIPQKQIQKELHEKKKNLLIVLIMMELIFRREKKILARLKKKGNGFVDMFCVKSDFSNFRFI